jgi:hypothetical protein
VVFITGQHEVPGDALRGDKLLEQRRRKLDVLAGGATNHHRPGRPAIIVQVLVRRDAEVKFVAVHGISVLAAKTEPGGKASAIGSPSCSPPKCRTRVSRRWPGHAQGQRRCSGQRWSRASYATISALRQLAPTGASANQSACFEFVEVVAVICGWSGCAQRREAREDMTRSARRWISWF